MQAIGGVVGIAAMIGIAWVLSERRAGIAWRPVWSGLLLALVILATVRWVPGARHALESMNGVLDALQAATASGTSFVFGYLGGAPLPFEPMRPGAAFVLATQVLPLVLVVSALSALLFHWGVLSAVVRAFAWVLVRTLGVGGAVGVSAAANAFVGMVEGPLVIRPWLARMTRGELFIVMNCGMATIAGTVLVLYAAMLRPILPDAIAVAAVMVPSEGPPDRTPVVLGREDTSALAAITRGTMEGVQLLINIVAMLVVFVALVALANAGLALLPAIGGAPVSAERVLGVVFAPLAWLVGVPWSEAGAAGQLLGKKTVLNEFVAYAELAALPPEALSPRSRLLMTYALAGFANFGSLGIMVGGLAPLLPAERRADLARLAARSLPAGLLSTCITAALVGLLA
jgi:CNT family concentrative nucleoside transporter